MEVVDKEEVQVDLIDQKKETKTWLLLVKLVVISVVVIIVEEEVEEVQEEEEADKEVLVAGTTEVDNNSRDRHRIRVREDKGELRGPEG